MLLDKWDLDEAKGVWQEEAMETAKNLLGLVKSP
jgi:hypothetical protein